MIKPHQYLVLAVQVDHELSKYGLANRQRRRCLSLHYHLKRPIPLRWYEARLAKENHEQKKPIKFPLRFQALSCEQLFQPFLGSMFEIYLSCDNLRLTFLER